MGAELPDLTPEEFQARVRAAAPVALSPRGHRALYLHYQELRRWNRRLSLVGPGTADEVVERHYGESLAILPDLPTGEGALVDVGSGAGFPGLVLAAALPRLRVFLVESRQRKWSFLCAATRRCGLSCACLNARVSTPLPAELPSRVDAVTLRAVKLSADALVALSQRLTDDGRLWVWAGSTPPSVPEGMLLAGERPTPGAARRRILEYRPAGRGVSA